MLSDIEIAQRVKMQNISEIAEKCGLTADETEPYGRYKAKINEEAFSRLSSNKDGKLILVTAINPTPAGEGKTTTTVGLGQAMNKIGRKTMITLREPSLGPVFGIKGGAAGGGYSQVLPMEDINLHFTGDFHAVTSANNLLCAMIDNHIQQGNEIGIDSRRILFKRVLDMNDRALRSVVIGLGGKANGIPREDGFTITVASEIMAIMCLADDIEDLKDRFSRILIGYKYNGEPAYCSELKAQGAMAALMKDAILPNLVQTTENTPCLIHGGPFANIAHGCNSVRATKLAMKMSDYVITEAGFGADLGAEKFMDIKCRAAGIWPSATVIVATARALKYNGGVSKEAAAMPDMQALERGIVNLKAHIDNMKKFNVRTVVAINKFPTDAEDELDYIKNYCKTEGVKCELSEVFEKGGEGGKALAETVCEIVDNAENKPNYLYDTDMEIKAKIEKIVKNYYGGAGAVYTKEAENAIAAIQKAGGNNLPVCMAKTQYSISDNPKLLGRPTDFIVNVRDLKLSAGAGFIVVYTGDVMTMPGLPKKPSAEYIDIIENKITGLF